MKTIIKLPESLAFYIYDILEDMYQARKFDTIDLADIYITSKKVGYRKMNIDKDKKKSRKNTNNRTTIITKDQEEQIDPFIAIA